MVGSVGGLIAVTGFGVDADGLFLIVALGIVVAFPIAVTALRQPTRRIEVV